MSSAERFLRLLKIMAPTF